MTVTYHPGVVSSDDTRKVVVLFRETDTPPVFLVVRAKVREAIICTPSTIELADLGRNQRRNTNFEVQNFSDRDWRCVTIQPSAPWLAASATPLHVARTNGTALPRQIWRATVIADSAFMSFGDYDAQITVTADGGEKFVRRVGVHVNVISPAVAVPEQFFFGNVAVGESATRSITLRFSPESIPKNRDAIHLQHTLGEQLRLTWLKTVGRLWELEATLTPNGTAPIAGQKVSIRFCSPVAPPLTLPVYAMVIKN